MFDDDSSDAEVVDSCLIGIPFIAEIEGSQCFCVVTTVVDEYTVTVQGHGDFIGQLHEVDIECLCPLPAGTQMVAQVNDNGVVDAQYMEVTISSDQTFEELWGDGATTPSYTVHVCRSTLQELGYSSASPGELTHELDARELAFPQTHVGHRDPMESEVF